MADRYWISSISSNWYNTINWSATSGGLSSGDYPDSSSLVYFDGNGLGACTIDGTVIISGLTVYNDYPGGINQNAYDMTITEGFFDGGDFTGDTSNISALSGIHIGRCNFIATDATMEVSNFFRYNPDSTGNFDNNNGVVLLNDTCEFDTTGSIIEFNTLIVDSTVSMDGTSITNDLHLNSGSIRDNNNNAHIMVGGDITTQSSYNDWSELNNVHLTMNNSGKHTITTSGVLPSLWIDKTDSSQVICEGSSPLYIRGPFIIKDGTFNSNGLNIHVGSAINTDTGSLAILD